MATKSLVTTVGAIDVPPVFDEVRFDIEPTRSPVPYVVFAQPKATEQWTEFATKLPGLQDGDQIMVHPEPGGVERLQPMRFTMMQCKQYWVSKDPAGNRLGASAEPHVRQAGWAEEVLAACLVYVPRGGGVEAVPASCVFKTVKCPAALSVKLQIDAAEKPEWADQSPAHKMAFAALAKPFLRVVGSVTTGKRTSSGGYGYVGARSIVSPATPAEWKAVKDLLESGGVETLRKLADHYRGRLSELKL